MADLTLAEAQKARDNLAQRDSLTQKMNSIEAQTITWMNEATALHGSVVEEDKQSILDLRQQLITKLQAALAV